MDYWIVLAVIFLAGLFVAGGLIVSRLTAPHRPGGLKNESYECGEPTVGSARIQYNVGYYLFALLFLVFDVESAFLFPWAIVYREIGLAALVEALIFIVALITVLVYAWRKGVLEWV